MVTARSSGAVRLGKTLRVLRDRNEWSLGDVASAVGLEEDDLAAIEAGYTLPTATILDRLADEYGVSVTSISRDLRKGDVRMVVPPQQGVMIHGIARTAEEAKAEVRAKKVAEVPYWPLDLPEDLTEPEFTAAIAGRLRFIEHEAIMINTTLRSAPEQVVNPQFRQSAQLIVRDLVQEAWRLRSVMEDAPVDIPSSLLNEERKGTLKPGYKLEFKFPDAGAAGKE